MVDWPLADAPGLVKAGAAFNAAIHGRESRSAAFHNGCFGQNFQRRRKQ
jgi:hypothetical protein